jgi:hypothetical protein
MLKWRTRVVLAVAVLSAGSGMGLADDARNKPADPALDDELLEFLGSVDTASDATRPDDGTWIEYLSQVDVGKVPAKPANPTVVAAKPAAPATPPTPKSNASGAKQDE